MEGAPSCWDTELPGAVACVAMSLSPSLVSVWSVPEVSEHPMSRMMFSTTRRQEKRCSVPGTLSGTLSVLFEPLEDGPHQEVPPPPPGRWRLGCRTRSA